MAKADWIFDRRQAADDFVDLLFQPQTLSAPQEKSRNIVRLHDVLRDLSPLPLSGHGSSLVDDDEERELARGLSDWYGLYCWEFIRGLGQDVERNLSNSDLASVRIIAQLWGGRLASAWGRFAMRLRWLKAAAGTFMTIIDQLPDEVMAAQLAVFAASPEFLREQAHVRYLNALFNGEMGVARHCMEVMAASDKELTEETEPYLTERSCLELWQYAKACLSEACTLLSTQSENIPHDRYDQAVQQLCGDLAWSFGLQMRDALLSDPERSRAVLEAIRNCPEAQALADEYGARYGWGGDRNRVIVVLYRLTPTRRFGYRPDRQPSLQHITRDDDEAELISLSKGIDDYTDKNPAPQGLTGALSGGLVPYLRTAREHGRASYVRSENRARGIEVPRDWSAEGMTVEEIRRRCREDDEKLSAKILPDYDSKMPEGKQSCLLQQAVERDSIAAYEDEQMETERQALLKEKVDRLCKKAGKLTPRQQLIAQHYEKDSKELAVILQSELGRPCSEGSARKLKHDFTQKLKNVVRMQDEE
ncbi:MAG: hypothetical protein R6U93_04825 [Dehalococcoidia bacterium]